MANSLQFNKEVQLHPGNSGTSKTRALVCELLAIKLLKDFDTRELIDALSYDFDPLQGLTPLSNGNLTPGHNWNGSALQRAARVSALEIAIRAQAKRFLAHPVVVQQLEAIWAGSIVFHSSADNLHRPPEKVVPNQNRGYGATGSRGPVLQANPERLQPAKQRDHLDPIRIAIRRSVTLYDPRDASLFKLSRLRVPRYRQFLSTGSFAILLGLYLAVLVQRSTNITGLEIVFWFWSAGFMLDEIVGFNEQGFSLYILSFWNAFDLGILMLFVAYYCLRLYGILMPDARKHHVASMSYDLLATNAVLLFPRLFSVLDHYRYFSQLLIAFRMMAVDFVAVFILILIACSGFFVAFTLSFGGDDFDANGVAYALFQILLGFTPAAWGIWDDQNLGGKLILTLFLFICHFLIVTILITVLTNSFMAIVQNANEEHQFLFAVNTISLVKSDALFSYVAPTNVIAWLLTPLRFFLPFRQFLRFNRTVIKITHFHILFAIYTYERMFLQSAAVEPMDLVEQRGRPSAIAGVTSTGLRLFSPRRLREPSVATYQKDRALDEVFRRPFRGKTLRDTQKSHDRRKTSNVVNSWMSTMGPNGTTANPPDEQDRTTLDRLEARRLAHRQSLLEIKRRQGGLTRDFTQTTMSIASDPEDLGPANRPLRRLPIREDSDLLAMSLDGFPQQTDADGDDELVTNDEDENVLSDPPAFTKGAGAIDFHPFKDDDTDYPQATPTAKRRSPPQRKSQQPSPAKIPTLDQATPPRPNAYRPNRGPNRVAMHSRNFSTNTVVYDPIGETADSSSSPSRKAITGRNSARNSGTMTPVTAGRRTPKRQAPGAARARPIMPPRNLFQSAPNLAGMLMLDQENGRRSSLTMDLGSDIGDNKAVAGGLVGAIPSSFATQMAFATGAMRAKQTATKENDDQNRMGKLMLARMNTLEEGFRDILKEFKDWRKDESRSTGDDRPEIKFSKTRPKKSARKEENRKPKAVANDGTEEASQVKQQDFADDHRGSSI